MANLFMIIFLFCAALHLFACFTGREQLRKYTKPALMPLLALWYALAAASFSPLVFAGLLLGCVGDFMLLRPEQTPRFALGLCAFLIGHLCYCAFMLPLLHRPPVWLLVVLPLLFASGTAFLYHGLRAKLPRIVKPAILAYMAVLCFASACTVLLTFEKQGMLPLFGSLLFLLSDTLLSREVFIAKIEKGNFLIMLTYLAAQALLSAGFALL